MQLYPTAYWLSGCFCVFRGHAAAFTSVCFPPVAFSRQTRTKMAAMFTMSKKFVVSQWACAKKSMFFWTIAAWPRLELLPLADLHETQNAIGWHAQPA